MHSTILSTSANLLHFAQLKISTPHPNPNGLVICQHRISESGQAPKLLARRRELCVQAVSSSHALDLNAIMAREEEVAEETLHDDVGKIVEILNSVGQFRYHKVPKLKAFRLKVTPPLVLKVLRNKEVKPLAAWKFFVWAKKQMGYKHTEETYSTIIPILLEMRKFTAVYFLMEDMYKERVSLTAETCLRMAKIFGSAGMVERAMHALNHMSRLGSPATTRHLNSVVTRLLESKHYYKAYIAVREMNKAGCHPDQQTFKLLLTELAKVEKVELGCHVFNAMQARGFVPDVETASAVVRILSRGGRVDEALMIFRKVKDSGVRQHARVYSSLLRGLVGVGDVDRALEIFEELHLLGFYSDDDSVATLIDLLLTNGREEDVQRCRGYLTARELVKMENSE